MHVTRMIVYDLVLVLFNTRYNNSGRLGKFIVVSLSATFIYDARTFDSIRIWYASAHNSAFCGNWSIISIKVAAAANYDDDDDDDDGNDGC